MRRYEKPLKSSEKLEAVLRLQSLSDPVISEYVAKLRSRYGKYALPAEEARSIIDQAMGEHTLAEVLHEMREEEF